MRRILSTFLVLLLISPRITSFRQLSSFSMYQTKVATNAINSISAERNISYINAEVAKAIDEALMSSPGFSIDQLMELAGFSVATAAHTYLSTDTFPCFNDREKSHKILLICGPGNNGGDGLVAARHLKHFGYFPVVLYPKKSKGQLFDNLVKQCVDLDIPMYTDMADILVEKTGSFIPFGLIVDALFGFSFAGPARPPFTDLITLMTTSPAPVISVDIPSGWHVENGDIYGTGFLPDAVISLTVPKFCMAGFKGVHYVGGR